MLLWEWPRDDMQNISVRVLFLLSITIANSVAFKHKKLILFRKIWNNSHININIFVMNYSWQKSLNLHTLGENDKKLYDFTNKPVLVQTLLKPVWNMGNPYWLTGMLNSDLAELALWVFMDARNGRITFYSLTGQFTGLEKTR